MAHPAMKNLMVQRGLDTDQVMLMIENALKKEKQHWNPHLYAKDILKGEVEEVDGKQRDYIVNWLSGFNNELRLMPETFFLAVALLDEFLDTVRARPKYLHCIAVVCFFIAIKLTEEDESIPTTHELVAFTRCGCSIAEVLRMEKIILTKLSWDVARVTAIDFAHLFHALLLLNCHHGASPSLERNSGLLWAVVSKLKWFLTFHEVLIFRPSTLALAVITVELENRTRDWFVLTVALQHAAKADNAELIRCRELLFHIAASNYSARILAKLAKQIPMLADPANFKPGKRKIEQTNIEDIYDSIKRLYAEEGLLSGCEAENPAHLPLNAHAV